MQEQQYKLKSMYAERSTDCLLFQVRGLIYFVLIYVQCVSIISVSIVYIVFQCLRYFFMAYILVCILYII